MRPKPIRILLLGTYLSTRDRVTVFHCGRLWHMLKTIVIPITIFNKRMFGKISVQVEKKNTYLYVSDYNFYF